MQVDYLPNPMEVPAVRGTAVDDPERQITRPAEDNAPLSALAFKIMADKFVGSLTFLRIYRWGPAAVSAVSGPVMHVRPQQRMNPLRPCSSLYPPAAACHVPTGE